MHSSAPAAVTNHRWEASFPPSGPWRSGAKALAGLVSPEASPEVCRWPSARRVLTRSSLCVAVSDLLIRTWSRGSRATLVTSFYLSL